MRGTLAFVAGTGAGVYLMVRVRRAAEIFTPEGMRDRLAGLQVGARMFRDELVTAQAERETELRRRFGLVPTGPPRLEAAEAARVRAGLQHHGGRPGPDHGFGPEQDPETDTGTREDGEP